MEPIDETPFGHYVLQALVGEGGMGRVYRAFDTTTNRVVALKVLPHQLARDAAFRQRFLREAQIAASLSEPHVVPIHRFGELDGQLYVDMRLIEGRDLQSELAAVGTMEPARAIHILEQVAAALQTAHASGLVHRDVKPSNILITPSDFAYLIDFGIARGADHTSLTSAGSTIGTIAYMAPERFEHDAVDARSDVYALACVLFECLAGRRVVPGSGVQQQIAAHLFAPAPRLSDVDPRLRSFDDVIARGLAKDPRQRYQSTLDLMAAARAASERAGADSSTAAAPTRSAAPPTWLAPPSDVAPTWAAPPAARSVPQAPRSAPRWPWIAAAVLAIVALVTGGVVVATRGGSDEERAATSDRTASSTRSTSGSSDSPGSSGPTSKRLDVPLPPGVESSGRLTVATNVPYAPAEFMDSGGRLVGFDVDLMNAAAAELGLTVDFQESDFVKIIPAVQDGTVDVGMAAFTDTRERQQSVDMVNYFLAGTQWGRRPGTAVTPDDACGLRVAVQATTVQETDELPARSQACTEAGKPAITVLPKDRMDQVTAAVADGNADAFSADSPVTGYAVKTSAGRLEPAGPMFDVAPYGWPVERGSPLGEALKQAVAQLVENGTYHQILEGWGVEAGAIDSPAINSG